MSNIYGIDVSELNGWVDWSAVKAAGKEFVIVRSSYGKHNRDENFRRNVVGAAQAGLTCGAYHYGYGLTPEDAEKEARSCKRIIEDSGVLLGLPVFYDMEDADGYKARKGFDFSCHNVTEMCRRFLREIKPLHAGIYASWSWFTEYIDWQQLYEEFQMPVWCAAWGPTDPLKGFCWQYSDALEIDGKTFDADLIYA